MGYFLQRSGVTMCPFVDSQTPEYWQLHNQYSMERRSDSEQDPQGGFRWRRGAYR